MVEKSVLKSTQQVRTSKKLLVTQVNTQKVLGSKHLETKYKVSNAIHQKTLRGGANFIVVSPETATILESIPGYATTSDGDSTNNQYAMGVQKAVY